MDRKAKRTLKQFNNIPPESKLLFVQSMVDGLDSLESSTKSKLVQAMSEGWNYPVALDSLLDGTRISGDGEPNLYNTYMSQVIATIKMYNGRADFGNDQVRAVVDMRSSFISGEGVSIGFNKESPKHSTFFEQFLKQSKLSGTRMFDIIKQTEMTGKVVITIRNGTESNEFIPVLGVKPMPSATSGYYVPIVDKDDIYTIKGLALKAGEQAEAKTVSIGDFVFIRTGGDGCSADETTTKIGILLSECESYDRALRDIRVLNHKLARITPSILTQNQAETKATTEWMIQNRWKIGDMFIGTGKFDYNNVGTQAHQNIATELAQLAKIISGVSGCPVHWLGHVDMMSNRATAEELYNQINNATITERTALEQGIYDVLVKAQEHHINSGGTMITSVNRDFTVSFPLMDFGRFESMVKAWILAYDKEIVCKETVRSNLPGVDPMFEAKKDKEQEKDKQKKDQETTNNMLALLNQEEFDEQTGDSEDGSGDSEG